MRQDNRQVIVVGGGPAGAVVALLLSRAQIPVTLLERQTDFAREFRGEVLMPGGLEPLHAAGLWDLLDKTPHVALTNLKLYANRKMVKRLSFDPEVFDRFTPRWVSQPELLEGLVAEASKSPCFSFERGATVKDLIEEAGRVRGVRIRSGKEEREIRADLVIGADGRGSVVRRLSSVEVNTFPLPMDIVWLKIPLPRFDPHENPHCVRVYVGGGSLVIAAPTPDERMQLAWIIRKGSYGDLRKKGFPELVDRIAARVESPLSEHLISQRENILHPFLLSTVSDHVKKWSIPGVLLLGDAAHTMSPVGAQGLNLAIRDAIVAANHLAPALKSEEGFSAIDSATTAIEKERRDEIERIQFLQSLPPKIVLRDSWWTRRLLDLLPLFASAKLAKPGNKGVAGQMLWGVSKIKSST